MRELLLEQFQDRKEQVEKFCDYFFDEKPVDGLDFEVAATIAMFLCRQLNAIVENSACTGFLIIQDGLFSDSNSKLNQGLNQLEFLRKTYSNKEYLAKLKQIYPCTPPQNKFAAEQNLFMVFGLIFEAEMFAKRDRYLFGNLMMQAKKYLENVADFFDKTRQDFFKGLQLFIDYELAQNALCPDEGQQKILDNENLKFRCGVDLYTLATIKERLDLDKISKKDAQNLKRNNPAKYVAMQNLRAIRADKIDDPAKYYEVFFKILCEQGEDLTDQENKDAMVEQYQNYCKSVDVAPLSVGSFAAQMLYCSVILARKVQNNLRYFEQERDKIYTLFSAQNEQPSEVAKFCLDTMISLHQSAGKIDAIDAAIDLISNLKDKFFFKAFI